ncbi:rhodanese-related sulfurtransferase [Plasticicumulans lactativorans]|uniref:Rhodanese-related sulfurtransferase n=1 Tax=Plasticicumulans lactativorans TaxID=1133106 RepID=A0A4R2LHZ6_9GAMM|nr:rhodanese-like domain-containing protein [Plasticicumulans lactativorans]TCO82761.1 rhodanese-related sulfurtransferase [Plasticicumulans lactativorans]
MPEFLAFAQKHWMLFAALFAILGMLIVGEFRRRTSGAYSVTPMEALRLMNDADAAVVDVREVSEFRVGHIPEARSLPAGELDRRVGELEKFKSSPLIVYCQNGERSLAIARKLRDQGFASARALAGGLFAWQGASLPTVRK